MGLDHNNTEDAKDKSSSEIEDSRFFIVNQYCKSRAYMYFKVTNENFKNKLNNQFKNM